MAGWVYGTRVLAHFSFCFVSYFPYFVIMLSILIIFIFYKFVSLMFYSGFVALLRCSLPNVHISLKTNFTLYVIHDQVRATKIQLMKMWNENFHPSPLSNWSTFHCDNSPKKLHENRFISFPKVVGCAQRINRKIALFGKILEFSRRSKKSWKFSYLSPDAFPPLFLWRGKG